MYLGLVSVGIRTQELGHHSISCGVLLLSVHHSRCDHPQFCPAEADHWYLLALLLVFQLCSANLVFLVFQSHFTHLCPDLSSSTLLLLLSTSYAH